jgi:hypothetical protein
MKLEYKHFDTVLGEISKAGECGISKVQIIENLGISLREVDRTTQLMKRKRLICAIGSARGSLWILVEYRNNTPDPEKLAAVRKHAEAVRVKQIEDKETLILDAIPDMPIKRRYSIGGDQPPPETTAARSVFELAR